MIKNLENKIKFYDYLAVPGLKTFERFRNTEFWYSDKANNVRRIQLLSLPIYMTIFDYAFLYGIYRIF